MAGLKTARLLGYLFRRSVFTPLTEGPLKAYPYNMHAATKTVLVLVVILVTPIAALAEEPPTGLRLPAQHSLIPANPVSSPRDVGPGHAAPLAQSTEKQKPLSFDEKTQAYRKMMRERFPEMPQEEFEMYVNYGIEKQRARVVQEQAARIRVKDKYPNLSQEEQEVLVQDEIARYRAAEERQQLEVPQPPPILFCSQMRMGAFSTIDCY